MSQASSNQRRSRRLNYAPPKDFYFAFGFAVLTALLHAFAQISEFNRVAGHSTLASTTVLWLLVVIGLGLIINVVGLWLRSAAGILISIAALLSVGVAYLIWYVYSRLILKLLWSSTSHGLPAEAVPPHPFGLISATWLNLVILAMSGALLIWELKTLRAVWRSHPTKSAS